MKRVLTRSSIATVPCLLLLLLVAALVSVMGNASITRVAINFFIAVVLAVGIQIFSGNTGIVSFGHVAFMGIGAYVGALVMIPPELKSLQVHGLPSFLANAQLGILPAMAIAGIATGACALVVGIALMRMRENAIAMATIALLVIFQVIVSNWQPVTNGSVGLYGVPSQLGIWESAALAAISTAVALCFRYSKTGLKTRGTSDDSLAAAAMGANVKRLRLISWVFSAAVMGVGGAAWGSINSAFTPASFSFTQTFALLAILVVGGMTSVSGVVAGAVALSVTNELLRQGNSGFSVGNHFLQLGQGWSSVIVPVLIVAILVWRPKGIVGLPEWGDRLAGYWLRGRLAASRRGRGQT